MNVALVLAGGVGNRMGQNIPKQFINVNDKPVIISNFALSNASQSLTDSRLTA